jgi:hypothetical protein
MSLAGSERTHGPVGRNLGSPGGDRDGHRAAWPTALLARASAHVEPVVFLVAASCRLAVILRSGGLRGDFAYDAPLYFAASDALIHGRMPYRDFVFLHRSSSTSWGTTAGWIRYRAFVTSPRSLGWTTSPPSR